MIVDFHTHTFPDAIAAAAVSRLQNASHTRPFTDGTAAALRRSMARAGICWSLVMPVATDPRQVEHINDAAARTNAAAETGIFSFGCMHPDFAGALAELGRIAELGLKGVKLHPPYQGADLDDPRYLRILDRAGELGLIVLVHAGLDVGLPGADRCAPEMVLRALGAVGPVKLVLAHMGGWRQWDRVERLLPGSGVYLDTSFSLGTMTPNGDGHYKTAAELELLSDADFLRMVRAFGADRVLFGTDCPWADQAAEVRRLRALPLTEAEKTAILGENARALLGLPGEN